VLCEFYTKLCLGPVKTKTNVVSYFDRSEWFLLVVVFCDCTSINWNSYRHTYWKGKKEGNDNSLPVFSVKYIYTEFCNLPVQQKLQVIRIQSSFHLTLGGLCG
jgi:hypothetical protein